MVVLGGLEFVAGGYLLHRYHKNKNEKKRLEVEAQQRRHNTFPGTKPQTCYPYQQPMYAASQPAQCPQQKYAYYAPQTQSPPQFQPQPQPQPQLQLQPQLHPQYYPQPRPQPVAHAQSFEIPRRPVPQRQPLQQPPPQQHHHHQQQQQPPPIIIQPLQRSDSFATISRMPIANGYRPSDAHEAAPALPPRPTTTNLSPIPQSPYASVAFSRSSPALAPAPHTPITPVYASPLFGRQTIDDNWETYAPQQGHQPAHGHYAPSESTALGEDDPNDPPPPYVP